MNNWDVIATQRGLTVEFLNRRRLRAPAIWLKAESEFAKPEDAAAPSLDTVLDNWLNPDDERNLGVRLVDGYVELKVKAVDDVWTLCFFEACRHLAIDARASYGSWEKAAPPCSIILRIEDAETIERWRHTWPRGWKTGKGDWTEIELNYSSVPTAKAVKPIWRHSHPLPGSRFAGKPVVWKPFGAPATEPDHLEVVRELAATSMNAIVRANAYATLLYWTILALDDPTGAIAWDASLIRRLGGWLAREVIEGRAVNAVGKSLQDVSWSPIDTVDHAEDLLSFLHKAAGAPKDLDLAFEHAQAALQRDPFARVPHWAALGSALTDAGRIAVRRAFRAGQDIEAVERFADRYVYDMGANVYFDRDALLRGTAFTLEAASLLHRHSNEPVFVGLKKLNPFQLYTQSALRVDVAQGDLLPGHPPAGVLRASPRLGVISADTHEPDEFLVFNTFRGFVIQPASTVSESLLSEIVSMVDVMLALITRDHDGQMLWLKQWTAWTILHPEEKQQVSPMLIGGQGIGKSRLGKQFMTALFDDLAGEAEGRLLSGDFGIGMFLNKLVVFLDEVVFMVLGSVEQIKKIIRSDRVHGSLKGQDARTYNVYARCMFASNRARVGLSESEAADRSLFWIIGHDADSKKMTAREFQIWTASLTDFYIRLDRMLKTLEVRRHLMHYLVNVIGKGLTIKDVISLEHSSAQDSSVVEAMQSTARRICQQIAVDGTVDGQTAITAWFNFQDLADACQYWGRAMNLRVNADEVRREFIRAGVLEEMGNGWLRFKYQHKTLLQKLGEAFGVAVFGYATEEGENPVTDPSYRPRYAGKARRTFKQAEGGQRQQPSYPDDEGPMQ